MLTQKFISHITLPQHTFYNMVKAIESKQEWDELVSVLSMLLQE